MENKNEFLLAGVFFLLLLIGGIGYFYWQNNQESAENLVVTNPTTSATGGLVKSFTQDEQQPVLGDSVAEPVQAAEESVQSTTTPQISEKPYILDLPSGWERTDSKTDKDPCEATQEIKTNTYKKGSETLIVYENGHPGGCDRSGVADVYLDYNYTEDNSGLKVNTSKIEQCSKDDNPDCPKGDGRVSLFIGNKGGSNEKDFVVNELTGKTYFFSVSDSSIDSSFQEQVKGLAKLVEQISFQ